VKNTEEFLHPEWMRGCALCKDCGRTVHDFVAPDDLWIEAWGSGGGTLCYDCFCERLIQKGFYAVFELKLQDNMKKYYYQSSVTKVEDNTMDTLISSKSEEVSGEKQNATQ